MKLCTPIKLISILFILSFFINSVSATNVTYNITSDTWVASSNPDDNFDAGTSMKTQGAAYNPNYQYALVDLGEGKSGHTKSELHIYNSAASGTQDLYAYNTGIFVASTVTYNTRPTMGSICTSELSTGSTVWKVYNVSSCSRYIYLYQQQGYTWFKTSEDPLFPHVIYYGEEIPEINNTINYYPDLIKTNNTHIYVNSSALVGSYVNLSVTIQTESCNINQTTFLYENCIPYYTLIPLMNNSWIHDEVEMSENINGFLEAGNNTDSLLGSYLDLGSYQLLYNILFYNVTLHNVTGEILGTDSLQFSPYFVEMVQQNESNITIPNWTQPPDIDNLNISWDLPGGQNSTNTTINTSNLDDYSSFINETSTSLNSSLAQIDGISTGLFSGINSSIQTIKTGLNSQNNTKSVNIICSYSCLFNLIPLQIQMVIVLDLLLTCFLIIMRH